MKFVNSYARLTLNPKMIRKTVQNAAKTVRKLQKELDFQAIAFRGFSGAAVAYPISYLTQIPLILVRKKGESTHGFRVEGSGDQIERYIIIDDFTDTGDTLRFIIDEISNWSRDRREMPPMCVGAILYGSDEEVVQYQLGMGRQDLTLYKIRKPEGPYR